MKRLSILMTALLTVGCFMLSAAGGAQAAQPTCEAEYCPPPPLVYKGGKIQTTPSLYVIFWGSNWNQARGEKMRAQVIKMYKGFSGSSYQGILTQYFDKGGNRVGNTLKITTYTDTKVAAPTTVTKEALEKEVKEALAANATWSEEPNGQYIVIPAPGTTYSIKFTEDRSCAFHSILTNKVANLSWSFVPFTGDEPFLGSKTCNIKGNVNAETMASASHEYAESATDPVTTVPAWVTPDEQFEITDLCYSDIFEQGEGAWVEMQWDNFKNECTLTDEAPAFVYAITEPATAITETGATLEGKINSEGMETKYWFEYGTTPTEFKNKTAEQVVAGSFENKTIKQAVTGLTLKTAYYYVLVGKNAKGTAKGRQQKFTTL